MLFYKFFNKNSETNYMARIIENSYGRRLIRLSKHDVLSVVREYQQIANNLKDITDIEIALTKRPLFIPEEL